MLLHLCQLLLAFFALATFVNAADPPVPSATPCTPTLSCPAESKTGSLLFSQQISGSGNFVCSYGTRTFCFYNGQAGIYVSGGVTCPDSLLKSECSARGRRRAGRERQRAIVKSYFASRKKKGGSGSSTVGAGIVEDSAPLPMTSRSIPRARRLLRFSS